jgi:KaiC/GvpD/RAD55 family RecA-like ATPase
VGLPVEVPGLDTIIPEIGDGRVVVVESGADSAKSFFIRRLGLTAIRNRSRVTFVISRDRGELAGQLEKEGGLPEWLEASLVIHEEDAIKSLDGFAPEGGLLAVDSFSFLTLDLPPEELAPLLRNLRSVCRERRTTAILATDRGMFEPRAEAIAVHLADGLIQFHAKEGAEGVVRFLRIPKWMEGKFVDRNIYYEFDGHRLAIDLRRRVL